MKMNSFMDPYVVYINKIIDFLPKDIKLPIKYESGRVNFFERKVSMFFRQRPRIFENEVGDTLFSARIAISKGGFAQWSSGAGTTKEEALFLAQAEFLERVSSWRPLNLVKNSDFSISGIKKDEKVLVQSLLGFRFARTASGNVYWGLMGTEGIKNQITTSGIAGHFDKKGAVTNAWLELIERDAFLVHWLNTISPRHIDVTTLSESETPLSDHIKEVRRRKYEYYVLDISSDIAVPVYLVLTIAETEKGKRLGIGAKAGFDVEGTILKASMESLSVLSSVIDMKPDELPGNFTPFKDVRVDRKKRIELSMSEAGFRSIAFLISSQESISLGNFKRTVASGVASAKTPKLQFEYLRILFRKKYKKDKRYDVFMYSCKNTLTKLFGFYVVRVMCGALYPMYLNEQFADPHHPRLKEFVTNKGLEKVAKLNTFPHPFP